MTTLNNAIITFLSHCRYEKHLSLKTLKAYKIDLNQFSLFIEDNEYPQDICLIDKVIVRAFIQSISGWKSKTIKRKIATTKALFNFLEFDDLIEINPFRKIKIRIKETRVLPTVMDVSEIKCLLTSAYKSKLGINKVHTYCFKEKLRDLAVIELLFTTGIRVSELVGLKVDHVDLKTGYIKVRGKGNKERMIQVCNREALKSMREYYSIFRIEIKASEGCFFINRLNRQLSDQSVRFMVKKYADLAGIKKRITPHVFRHSFATLLLEEDVDIKYIQHMLGHSSIAITQIYTHVNQEKQRKILQQSHPRKHFKMSKIVVV
jgi:integrase/recombinase XerD